jgi:alginate O-acetyltransferase complex protein AlgI
LCGWESEVPAERLRNIVNFAYLQILGFALLAVTVLRLPPGIVGRELRIFVLNVTFVAIYFSNPKEAVPVAAFVLLGYGALLLARHLKNPWLLAALLSSIIIVYIWLKQYDIVKHFFPLSLKGHGLSIVGLSYVLFRIIHLIIDYKDATVPSFLRYLNYCYFFPNFLSGPIQRFQDYQAQIDRPLPPLTVSVLHEALGRIMLGIVMTLAISVAASNVGLWAQNSYYGESDFAPGTLWLSFSVICYLLNIFSNFSGYMHIIVGFGKICGFDIPENFNRPYQARNFLDLWARWHITLSEWFKFYLFNPLLKLLVGRWDNKTSGPYLAAIAYFFTFLVMGIWHGTTLLFVVYGTFLGLGAMVNKAWQVFLSNRIGKTAYRDLVQRTWYAHGSRALTLGYFAIALTCWWVDPSRLSGPGEWRVMAQVAGALFVVTMAFVLTGLLLEEVPQHLRKRFIKRPPRLEGEPWMVVVMAAKVAAVVYIIFFMGNSAPVFIYKDF